MIRYLQEQVQPAMRLILMASLLLLTLLGGYLYVIKPGLGNYRQTQQTLSLLQDELSFGVTVPEQLTATQNTVQQLEQQLMGSAPNMPINQKTAFVIGRLDAISSQHQVHLHSVKPGEVASIAMFQELPFNIELGGSYFKLVDWLQQVEQDLGPIVVKEFTLRPNPVGNDLIMKLTLVAYLFNQTAQP